MYPNLNDAIAREHRRDLLREGAAARTGQRSAGRRRGRNTGPFGRAVAAFHGWYGAGEL